MNEKPEIGEVRMSYTMQPLNKDDRPTNHGMSYANSWTLGGARDYARVIGIRDWSTGEPIVAVEIVGRYEEFTGSAWSDRLTNPSVHLGHYREIIREAPPAEFMGAHTYRPNDDGRCAFPDCGAPRVSPVHPDEVQRKLCRKCLQFRVPAVTLTFKRSIPGTVYEDELDGRLHWCAEHADDAENYRADAS